MMPMAPTKSARPVTNRPATAMPPLIGPMRAAQGLLLVDREVVLLFRLQAAHAAHRAGQLVFAPASMRFLSRTFTRIDVSSRELKAFMKRLQRHDGVRVEAEQAEERALLGVDADDAERHAADHHRLAERRLVREQRLGDVVAEDDDVAAAARLRSR